MLIELSVEVAGAPEGLDELLSRVADACCRVEGVAGLCASGRLVDDEAIRAINRAFRGVDRATDVLSFPSVRYPRGVTASGAARLLRREYDPEVGARHLGDFVISLPRAQAQAAEYGHSLLRELGYLTAHSMFHLMGYDHEDESEKRVMRALEERAMGMVSLGREG
ncbi:MAG: rRNA maturation RNase YbeY [Clostridia bacterium]